MFCFPFVFCTYIGVNLPDSMKNIPWLGIRPLSKCTTCGECRECKKMPQHKKKTKQNKEKKKKKKKQNNRKNRIESTRKFLNTRDRLVL